MQCDNAIAKMRHGPGPAIANFRSPDPHQAASSHNDGEIDGRARLGSPLVTCGDGKKANAGENRRYTSEKKVMAVTGFILGLLLIVVDGLIQFSSSWGACRKDRGRKKREGDLQYCAMCPVACSAC